MKLAICYTVYETELLAKSIANIMPCVDKIIICYQTVSNTGRRKEFKWSHEYNPKYHFVHYHTDLSVNPKENERRKHQMMIDAAREQGCTHYILSATDHFYMRDQVQNAKITAVDYDVTFTAMYTYYKKPTWQITPIEDYYMPFICSANTNVINQVKYPVVVDPSCRIGPYENHYIFKESECMLHHYSMVRFDLREKLLNSASGKRVSSRIAEFIGEYENYDLGSNPGVSYFNGRTIKEVPNFFNINTGL